MMLTLSMQAFFGPVVRKTSYKALIWNNGAYWEELCLGDHNIYFRQRGASLAPIYEPRQKKWTRATAINHVVSGSISAFQRGIIEINAIAVFLIALQSLHDGALTFGSLLLLFLNMSASLKAFSTLTQSVTILMTWIGLTDQIAVVLSYPLKELGGADIKISSSTASLELEGLTFH